MNGPFPSRLIRSAADSHAADADEFEPSFFKCAYFVGFFKPFQNSIKHRCRSVASRIWATPQLYSLSFKTSRRWTPILGSVVHSVRRARIGSSVAARRAGITAARNAANARAAVVRSRILGSYGFTPKS